MGPTSGQARRFLHVQARLVMIQSTKESPLPQPIDDEYLLPHVEGRQPVRDGGPLDHRGAYHRAWLCQLHQALWLIGLLSECFVSGGRGVVGAHQARHEVGSHGGQPSIAISSCPISVFWRLCQMQKQSLWARVGGV